ncbi:hypothetical protein [Cognaticolwellia mytili]|uniref:hypothetical protein n=1 Tax=Cognaticolwellia mytili TaxID=1888913 RepID=UPI000A175BA6|nr:hypothetical protein [Cognaticolwellia mytili]
MNEQEKMANFAKNITKAKAEDLVLIAKYTRNRKKSNIIQVFISSAIATMAGAAIFASYLFPELEKIPVAIISICIGVITVSLSFWQRKKEDIKTLRRFLRENDNPTEDDLEVAEEFRKEIIEAFESEDK